MLNNLASVLMCASNDIHVVHWYVRGSGFDTMHKVCNDLYNKLFEYADNCAELALETDQIVPNPNMMAMIIDWQATGPKPMDYDTAVMEVENTLATVVAMSNEVMAQLQDEGDKNFVAGLIEDMNKELKYFNKARNNNALQAPIEE